MPDRDATLHSLAEAVTEFARRRGWERFHTPRNVATALVVEAAELVEPFQWMSSADSESRLTDDLRTRLADEMADVMIYLLTLARVTGIDLADAVMAKIRVNEERYPTVAYDGDWLPRKRGT